MAELTNQRQGNPEVAIETPEYSLWKYGVTTVETSKESRKVYLGSWNAYLLTLYPCASHG